MIKCPICNGPMSFSAKGGLECPTCSNLNRSITITRREYGAFVYYKVVKRENIDTENLLLEEDVQTFLKTGIDVTLIATDKG